MAKQIKPRIEPVESRRLKIMKEHLDKNLDEMLEDEKEDLHESIMSTWKDTPYKPMVANKFYNLLENIAKKESKKIDQKIIFKMLNKAELEEIYAKSQKEVDAINDLLAIDQNSLPTTGTTSETRTYVSNSQIYSDCCEKECEIVQGEEVVYWCKDCGEPCTPVSHTNKTTPERGIEILKEIFKKSGYKCTLENLKMDIDENAKTIEIRGIENSQSSQPKDYSWVLRRIVDVLFILLGCFLTLAYFQYNYVIHENAVGDLYLSVGK